MTKRQLKAILESGEVDEVKIQETQVREALVELLNDGGYTPNIPAAEAKNSRVFLNSDTGRLSWKSPAGILMRFRMQLEP